MRERRSVTEVVALIWSVESEMEWCEYRSLGAICPYVLWSTREVFNVQNVKNTENVIKKQTKKTIHNSQWTPDETGPMQQEHVGIIHPGARTGVLQQAKCRADKYMEAEDDSWSMVTMTSHWQFVMI